MSRYDSQMVLALVGLEQQLIKNKNSGTEWYQPNDTINSL